MTTHTLKSWVHFFQAIRAGEKLHDIRSKKDRDFLIGDRVRLQEYDPFTGKYTGAEIEAEITYITSDVTPCAFSSAVLDKDYCVLSLRVAQPRTTEAIEAAANRQPHNPETDPYGIIKAENRG